MKEKIKDIIIRTLKTFLEGFVGALPITISIIELSDKAFMISLLIGCLSAGACAVLNMIIAYLKSLEEKYKK